MSERTEAKRPVVERGGPQVRLTDDLHQKLLTIQYQRRMAGHGYVSLNDIIAEKFTEDGAA